MSLSLLCWEVMAAGSAGPLTTHCSFSSPQTPLPSPLDGAALLSHLEFEQSVWYFRAFGFLKQDLKCPRVILKSWSCLHLLRARVLEVLPHCPISWLMQCQGTRQHSPLSRIPSPIYIGGYIFIIPKYLSCP